MEIIDNECYVSLEVAKLLKEAGFDWKVFQWYEVLSDGQVMYSDGSTYNWNNPCYGESTFSMPTLEVAQRWLREVKRIHIYVKQCEIYNEQIESWSSHLVYKDNDIIVRGGAFGSYEEALEAGIKKALELILKKGE